METKKEIPESPDLIPDSKSKISLEDEEKLASSAEKTDDKDPVRGALKTTLPISEKCEAFVHNTQIADSNQDEDVLPRESMDHALKSEKDFIEYVMSLPSSPFIKESPRIRKFERTSITKPKPKLCSTSASTTKVGLDHLDNLCKLMEQLSELKDTNTKLQKRVQYLEDLKTLHEMHKEIKSEVQYGSENTLSERAHIGLKKSLTSTDYPRSSPRGSEDYSNTRSSPRGSEDLCFQDQRLLKNKRSPSGKRSRAAHHLPYDSRRRERSKSVGHEEVFDGKSKRIFPKWSKVKEAFGFESDRKDTKTSKFYYTSDMGKTTDENVFSANRRIYTDIAGLRLPLYSDCLDKDGCLVECYAGEAMAACTDGFLPSFNSSAEDIPGCVDGYRSQKYSEGKMKSHTIDRSATDEKDESKKSHKSPWGRVKTIIEKRRDSLKRRHFRRTPHINSMMHCQETNYPGDFEDYNQNTIASYESQRKSSDDQYFPPNNQNSNDSENTVRRKKTASVQGKDGEKVRIKRAPPPIQINPTDRFYSYERRVPSQLIERDEHPTPGSSPQLNRKSTWTKMKNVLKSKKEGEGQSSQSMPSSPNGAHNETFDFEDTDILEDNQDLDCYMNKHCLSTSTPVSEIMLELQRNVSEDFTRKMQEWERIRGARLTASPKWERANSAHKSRKKTEKSKVERYEKSPKPKIKDLAWLEKELQKIEKEKQRLCKEKQKYEERAVRLERLRQTVLTARNSNKKEVLVRTSAGEFRFEGISDAFTKKLYEWETKRGLGPEFSTIALLDSSLGGSNKNCFAIQQMEKSTNLQRGLSRSESSIAEIGQLSHNSSNSLPSLKPPENGDFDKLHHHSRANSEPDLSSFVGSNSNLTTNQKSHSEKSSKDISEVQTTESYAHPEVTQLIDSDVDEVLGDIEDPVQSQRDENYYSLLEENVILLEQLKHKEEICRRLENELEVLDDKVDDMNKHHQQEMEKYREKLWEMHKPGNTPREIQGCLQVMAELQSRIENLEKCSEKLRNEKETLENSFRQHSEEQEHMTLDLLDKMTELQAAGQDNQKEIEQVANKGTTHSAFDIKIVERLQDLSGQLLKQTRDLEKTLAERTRQIFQLRWELLHRDVSSVKLETELHNAHMQNSSPGKQARSKSDIMRSKYAHFRSWSSEEASNQASKLRHSENQKTQPTEVILKGPYLKFSDTEVQTNKLNNTVHEINKELIRLSTAAEHYFGTDVNVREGHLSSSTSKKEVDDPASGDFQHNGEQVLDSSLDFETTDNINSKAKVIKSKISVRRNSASSVSMASGIEPDASKSPSCMNESNSSPRLLHNICRKATWSDSNSSSEDETFTRVNIHNSPESLANEEPDSKTLFLKKNKLKDNISYNNDNKKTTSAIKTSYSFKKRLHCKVVKNSQRTNTESDENPALPTNSTVSKHVAIHTRTEVCSKNSPAIFNKTNSEMINRSQQTHYLRPCHSAGQVQLRRTQAANQNLSQKDFQKSDTVGCISGTQSISASKSAINKNAKMKVSLSGKMDKSIFSNEVFQKSIKENQQNSLEKLKDKKTTTKKKNNFSKQKGTTKCSGLPNHTDSKEDNISNCDQISNEISSLNLTCQETSKLPENSKVVLKRKQFLIEPQASTQQHESKIHPSSLIPHEKGLKGISTKSDANNIKNLLMEESSTNDGVNFYNKIEETSNFTVKLPKRKASLSESSRKKLDKDSKLNTPEKLKVSRNGEQTATVIVPKKDISKSESNADKKVFGNFETVESDNHTCPEKTAPITERTQLGYETPKMSIHSNKHTQSPSVSSSTSSIYDTFQTIKSCPKNSQLTQSKDSSNISQSLSSQDFAKHYCLKSPSAPQLDWTKTCAKKVLRDGAPNVKTLIEKFNQKVLENQTPQSPYSSKYNSPITIRKVSMQSDHSQSYTKSIPYSFISTPSTPKVVTSTSFCNPFIFDAEKMEKLNNKSLRPPTSPNSKARSEALLKAKENFMSSTSITFMSENWPNRKNRHDSPKMSNTSPLHETVFNTTKRSATDSDITRRKSIKFKALEERDNIRKSICSNKSWDSMSLVLYKTGETCQESRMSKRNEKQKPDSSPKLPEKLKTSKSSSNSSLFKTVTGHEIKLPSSFLRLRRSRKNKDMTTVSQLCRQSLLLGEASSTFLADVPKSPRSCPSSPELASKSKSKSSWLQRNIFRHK